MGRRLLLSVLAAAALAAPAAAGERTLDQDLAAARALMKDEKWEAAAGALQRAMNSREGSTEVLDRLADIEEDLKVCLYRAKALRPSPQDLYGPCAKSMAAGRKLALEFPDGPREPEWKKGVNGTWILPIRYEKEVSLEFRSKPTDEGRTGVYAILCFDPDRETGYTVCAGYRLRRGDLIHTLGSFVLRMDGKDPVYLFKTEGPYFGRTDWGNYRFSCKSGQVTFAVATDSEGKRWEKNEVSDPKYRSGIVAVKGYSIEGLSVEGALEEVTYKGLVGSFYAKGFKEWCAGTYRREEVLPAWVLRPATKPEAGPAAPVGPAPVLLPADAGSPPDPWAVKALEAWRAGDRKTFYETLPRISDPSPGLGLYLRGLSFFGLGAIAQAEKEFSELVRKHPSFLPGWLYRGIARFHRRDLEGAKGDLEGAWDGVGSLPDFYLLRASMAIREDDFPKAREAIAEARRAGVAHPDLDGMATWVQRTIRGPAWVKRYEQKGPEAVIASDHSQQICFDTGVLIRATLWACNERFPGKRPPAPPIRVHVFSGREGFLEYAADIGHDLDSAAGAYIPKTREMVLFVPEVQRESLWRTIKHETFHAFLHTILENAPVWLNEGYAQWFENGKAKGETLLFGGVEADAIRVLREAGPRGIAPLQDLLLMETAKFRRKATLHYAESLALVHYLNGRGSPWRANLDDYLGSLREGLSQEEAYEKHWAPVLPEVEAGFRSFLDGLFREAGGR